MKQKGLSLQFDFNQVSSNFCKASVTIPASLVDKTYEQAVLAQSRSIRPHGFRSKEVPIEYVKQNFENNINHHLEEFLFKYFALNFLLKSIKEQKINIVGEPRITEVFIKPDQEATFNFDINLFPKIEFQNWKYYPFKAPKRKNYKDLDRQVEEFMKKEKIKRKETLDETIKIRDWISFDLWIVDENDKPIFGEYKENLWLKIGYEEADSELQNLFVGKKEGDIFYTEDDSIQEYFGTQIGSNYRFCIEIKDVLNNSFFCFDNFKRQFRLKTKKEMRKRLIEVFSYRNDISQRQAMVEETFKLMLSKYNLDVPNYLVLRQQKDVMEDIKKNPDYHVYKTQDNFEDHIKKLAHKQVKEIILIEQLANKENIHATDEDLACYLNLTKRPRMKEFIYFKMPETRVEGQETPIPAELIRRQCLREKTLNYIIFHLTRK